MLNIDVVTSDYRNDVLMVSTASFIIIISRRKFLTYSLGSSDFFSINVNVSIVVSINKTIAFSDGFFLLTLGILLLTLSNAYGKKRHPSKWSKVIRTRR